MFGNALLDHQQRSYITVCLNVSHRRRYEDSNCVLIEHFLRLMEIHHEQENNGTNRIHAQLSGRARHRGYRRLRSDIQLNSPAKQQKVIFGPYTSQCAGSHSFQVRGAPAYPRIVIQQLVNGSWNSVTAMSYNPSGRFEAGTFRVILDNSHYNNIQTYAVNFSVPT